MATTTQILSSMSSRNILGNCDLYQCRCPKHVSIAWPFHRHSKILNRHSFLDNSFLTSKFVFRSLPPTPRAKWPSDEEDALRTSSSSCVPFTGYSSEYPSAFFPAFHSEFETWSEASETPGDKRCDIPSVGGPLKPEEEDQRGRSQKGTKIGNVDIKSSSVLSAPSPYTQSTLPNFLPSSDSTSTSSSNSRVPPSSSSSSESSSSPEASLEKRTRKRVKDDEGYIRRAACVCVNEEESKVVLISSKHEGGGWLVPGGGLEDGEGNEEAAKREAWEEGGITGRIDRCLGEFQSDDDTKQKRKKTTVYVLKVTGEHAVFPEVNIGRVREWFSIEEAINHLSKCKPYQTEYLMAL